MLRFECSLVFYYRWGVDRKRATVPTKPQRKHIVCLWRMPMLAIQPATTLQHTQSICKNEPSTPAVSTVACAMYIRQRKNGNSQGPRDGPGVEEDEETFCLLIKDNPKLPESLCTRPLNPVTSPLPNLCHHHWSIFDAYCQFLQTITQPARS